MTSAMTCIALVLCASVTAQAAEFVVDDATFALESGPRSFRYRIDNGTSTAEGTGEATSHVGLRAGLLRSFSPRGGEFGPLLGGDLVLRRLDLGSGTTDVRVGLEPTAGFGWAPYDRWQVLLVGVVGLGIERYARAAGDGFAEATASGRWATYGLRLRAQYALNRQWWLGGETAWTDAPGSLSGDGLDLGVRPSGLGFALTLIYRIDATPTRLE